jgi:hypothetical protein
MKTIIVILLLLATTFATAQTDDHRFFDWKNTALLTVSATTIAGDGITTAQVQARNKPVFNANLPVGMKLGGEINPLARLFVKNPAGNAVYFGSSFAAEVGGMSWLHRHGHHRWERVMPMVVSGVETYWTIRNRQNVYRYDHYSYVPPAPITGAPLQVPRQ